MHRFIQRITIAAAIVNDQRREMVLRVDQLRNEHSMSLPEWAARLPSDDDSDGIALKAIHNAHEYQCRVGAWQQKARISTAANPTGVRIEAGWP